MLGGAIVNDFIEYFGGAIEQPDGSLKDISGAVNINVGHLTDWCTGCSTCGYNFVNVDLTFYDKDKRKLAGYKGADLTDFFRFVYDRSHG